MRARTWSAPLFLVPSLLMLLATGAWGADRKAGYEEALEQWSQRIGKLNSHSQSSQTTQEIELLRTWVGQGQALVANEKYKGVDALMERLDALAELIKVRQRRLDLDLAADRAEGRAGRAEARASAASKAVEVAEAKIRKLEARGL